MRYLILIAILILVFVPNQAGCNTRYVTQHGWELHFTAGLAGGWVCYKVLNALDFPSPAILTAFGGLSLTFLKEYTDKNFSWLDVAYSGSGITIGLCYSMRW
jgi:uncharacterized membrane protein AbrB (regulator of aidB expression)